MRKHGWVALLALAAILAAVAAATAQSAPARSTERLEAASAASAGKMSVRFQIKRFVRTQGVLRATGEAVATYVPSDGSATTTVRRPFSARVVVPRTIRTSDVTSQARICPVLFLQLDKLFLNLLGLHVDLDKVVLRITADSRGGVLGSLFCSLSRQRVRLLSPQALTKMAKDSGLATSGVGFAVPVLPKTVGQASTLQPSGVQPREITVASCKVLDLILGPLDLNLLGLMVHLDQVHLQITADPNGGVLGSLFCALAGGLPPPPPIP
jgi:hypothetical protein